MGNQTFAETQLELERRRSLTRYFKEDQTVHKYLKQDCNAIVYTFESDYKGSIVPKALGFFGRTIKPTFHYRFKDAQERDEYVEKFFQGIKRRNEIKAERKSKQNGLKAEMAEKIKIGTILHGSWGYEQTNPEFYQVIARPTRFKAVIQPIKHETVPGTEDYNACMVRPIKDAFVGSPETKLIQSNGISFSLFCLSPCNPDGRYHKSWGY